MKVPFFLCALVLSACSTGSIRSEPSRRPSQAIFAANAVTGRSYPSTFQAWQPLTPVNSSDAAADLAKHDLIWQSWSAWGLKCANGAFQGLCTEFTPQSLATVLQLRKTLQSLNPHIIMLAEIRYHDAISTYLPEASPWWLRNASGNRVPKTTGTSTANYFMLDFSNVDFQNSVASLCQKVVATGAFDGCMFDWWNTETPAHLALIQRVRRSVGEDAILVANVNGSRPQLTAAYLNGIYMEGFGESFFPDWQNAQANLLWAQDHLHQPAFTALDAWGTIIANDNSLRFPLALSLVFSNGYFLFGDDLHNHVWHPMWSANLGKAVTAVSVAANANGTFSRDYENGTVILNPPQGSVVTLSFDSPRLRASTGETASQFVLQPNDGDFFLQ